MRAYRVMRWRDDPKHVGIDLEFDSEEEADSFDEQLTRLWQRIEAEGLITEPRPTVVELEEDDRR